MRYPVRKGFESYPTVRQNNGWCGKVKLFFYKALAVLALFALLGSVYSLILRPHLLHWGATEIEISRSMPGDDLVLNATFTATRAVTIEGTMDEIWPWIVQMGYGRAGFYGYDLLEGIGSPSGMRSAKAIIPEFQQLAIGDDLKIYPGANSIISVLEKNRYLVWGCEDTPCTCAFTLALDPLDAARTRLVSRARCDHVSPDPRLFLFTELFDHIALKKILLGIKGRVEGQIEPNFKQDLEFSIWLFAIIEFFTAIIQLLALRSWQRSWLVALGSGSVLLSLYFIGYQVWLSGFLVIGILCLLLWNGKKQHLKNNIPPIEIRIPA